MLMLSWHSNAQALFPYYDGSRWGYINAKGIMAIAPAYRTATPFSEGLAAVRTEGTYGYINASGSMVIAQAYDFALPFHGGLAMVYSNGRPLLIDKQGRERLRNVYARMAPTEQKGYWLVATDSGRQGIINDAGKIIIDTVYKSVRSFSYGRAVVVGFESGVKNEWDEDDREARKMGVLDTAGHWVIPFGKWRDIAALREGYYSAVPFKKNEDNGGYTHYLDHQGKDLFHDFKEKKWFVSEMDGSGFGSGVSVVVFFLNDEDSLLKKILAPDQHAYFGAIDTNGNLLFSNTNFRNITSFSSDRAFAQTGRDSWILIDQYGRQIGSHVFTGIIGDIKERERSSPFENGLAFVKVGDSVATIDASGNYVLSPVFLSKDLSYKSIYRKGKILIMSEDISTENEHYSYKYGFRDPARNINVTPRFYEMDFDAFGDSLIAVTTADERNAYIDNTGKIVWLGKKPDVSKKRIPLNIDFMNRGYFYAASSGNKKELNGFGGWGSSDNKAGRNASIRAKELKILIGQDTATWAKAYKGRPVYVVNGSRDTAFFNAQDSRLYMNVQATTPSGEWKDIEYLPSSWCGNSYHTMYLAPGEQWAFTMPVYEGSIPVKLRMKLHYKTTRGRITRRRSTAKRSQAASIPRNSGASGNISRPA